MNKFTRYLSKAGLASFGQWMIGEGIWKKVESEVPIRQKVVVHTPQDKLLDAFINTVSGGEGIVEVNTRVRPEEGLCIWAREVCGTIDRQPDIECLR